MTTCPTCGGRDPRALTTTEQKVFMLICDGLSNAEIGERMFITVKTVKFHVTRILAKIDVDSRAQLIVKFYKRELSMLPKGQLKEHA